ncbi:MAG: DUF1289 domain-containing protein [Chlorobi bacterium]|nr:DUF1289 domain-containing protein [Chlorobiota bacterium]
MSEIHSPCIKQCFRDTQDVCFGCRRTGEEIGNWSKMTNEEKQVVIDKTYRRTNVAGEMPPGNYLR